VNGGVAQMMKVRCMARRRRWRCSRPDLVGAEAWTVARRGCETAAARVGEEACSGVSMVPSEMHEFLRSRIMVKHLSSSSSKQVHLEHVGKNILITNNPDLILRKSILTKNDAITQHK
jgi:hypothetical protein